MTCRVYRCCPRLMCDTRCRHFDKLTKDEQVAVLKDALGRKERLEKLEGMSEKFDDTSVLPTFPLFVWLCCARQACAGQLRSTFGGAVCTCLGFPRESIAEGRSTRRRGPGCRLSRVMDRATHVA